MSEVRKHNPYLEKRLRTLLAAGDSDALLHALGELSNAEFRTAGYLLGEVLLPELAPDRFEDFFFAVVPTNPKAFLGTFLKAAASLYAAGALRPEVARWQTYAAGASQIDRKKILECLLPLCKAPQEAQTLLALFALEREDANLLLLIGAATLPALYVLFLRLRTLEHDKALLRHYCIVLMQKGGDLNFRMAAFLQAYFDVGPLPGTLSRHIEPYHLARFEGGYDSFKKMLLR